MGASATAGTRVDVENVNFTCGEEVTGVVEVLVKEPTAANGLALFLKGKEKTHWSVRGKYARHYFGATHLISKVRYQIATFTEPVLQPGQYSFPFRIQLPTDLPTSFKFNRGIVGTQSDEPWAMIYYKLIGELEGHKIKTEKWKTFINITRVEQVAASSAAHQDFVAHISTWCCLKKGTVRMKIDFNKTHFLPGETALVTIEADNQGSELNGVALNATVTRSVRMKDNWWRSHIVTDVVQQTHIPLNLPFGQGEQSKVLQTLQVTIPNDESVQQCGTTHGHLLECEYSLTGALEMDGTCMCSSDATSMSKTMTVFPAQIEVVPPVEIPEDWKAVMKPMAILVTSVLAKSQLPLLSPTVVASAQTTPHASSAPPPE